MSFDYKNSLSEILEQRKIEMNKYRESCKQDAEKAMVLDFSRNNSQEYSLYLHNNFDNMTVEEKKNAYLNILTEKKIFNELLKYELRYLDLNTIINDLPEFSNFMKKYFERYHMKAGGYDFEDSVWTIYDENTVPLKNYDIKYKVKKNEIIFENSIKNCFNHDHNNSKYVNDLKRFFKRHMGPNLKLMVRYIEGLEEINWVIFKLYIPKKKSVPNS